MQTQSMLLPDLLETTIDEPAIDPELVPPVVPEFVPEDILCEQDREARLAREDLQARLTEGLPPAQDMQEV